MYRIFDPGAAILRCFGCHSTGPVSLAPDESIVPGEAGVRCEVCHGPGEGHARDPKGNRLRTPDTMAAAELNDFCGACHRMPVRAGEATDLKNPWNARHQPLMLAASQCFLKSSGKLSCFNCHAPHTASENAAEKYEAACRNCHRDVKHTVSVAPRRCVECHMPKVRLGEALVFANHRIGVYGVKDPMSPVSRK